MDNASHKEPALVELGRGATGGTPSRSPLMAYPICTKSPGLRGDHNHSRRFFPYWT